MPEDNEKPAIADADDQPFTSDCCGVDASGSMLDQGMCPCCRDHCSFSKYDADHNLIEEYTG